MENKKHHMTEELTEKFLFKFFFFKVSRYIYSRRYLLFASALGCEVKTKQEQLYFRAHLDYRHCCKYLFFLVVATEYGHLFKMNHFDVLSLVLLILIFFITFLFISFLITGNQIYRKTRNNA